MIVMSGESTSFGDQEGFDPAAVVHRPQLRRRMQRMLEPLVKWSGQALRPRLSMSSSPAGELAQSNPAGPVYLDVPIEMIWRHGRRPRAAQGAARDAAPTAGADIERVAKCHGREETPSSSSAARDAMPKARGAGRARRGACHSGVRGE